MIDFIKKNKLFSLALFASIVSGLALIYGIGFLKMVKNIDPLPERLRNQTFQIWDHQPMTKHGFLAFYEAQDFEKKIAYTGYSPFYLIGMYYLYKVELICNKLPMRIVAPSVAMLLCLYVLFYAIISRETVSLHRCKGTLLILSMIAFLTTPVFWISLGKTNVDNIFIFIMPLIIWVAFLVSTPNCPFLKLCIGLVGICLIAPTYGFLLAIFIIIWELGKSKINTKLLQVGIVTSAISILLFLVPHIFAKLLEFKSCSSSWWFRSGLDGDISFFSNAFNAIFLPYKPRSVSYIVWPLCLLLAQLLFIFKNSRHISLFDSSNLQIFDSKNFFSIIFSCYIFTVLFWPQAVSIHPYLYDILLLGGISTWILFNFKKYMCFSEKPIVWVFLLFFLISFNIQKIAQAARAPLSCIFPA